MAGALTTPAPVGGKRTVLTALFCCVVAVAGFSVHLFHLDKWSLYPLVWKVPDTVIQTRADCMVQLYQVHADAAAPDGRHEAARAFESNLRRLYYAQALPAAELAIEPDPTYVTLTFVTDCARREQMAQLASDYHRLMDRRAPRFRVLSGPVTLADTAHPARGPAWSDGQ